MTEPLQELMAALEQRAPVALMTVVDVKGASPAQVGFKLLVRSDGTIVGNLGGGALESQAREDALTAMKEGRSRLAHYSLREEGPDAVGMLCGGEVTVFIEVHQPSPKLIIVGGGHIGRPLSEMARIVGFDVQVVDVRPERSTAAELEPATITSRTYVVVITEDHVSDEQTLRRTIETPAAYIGMVGSRRKAETILEHLRKEGVSESLLARVRAPIGLDLGGRSPAEIALAILAEVVQVRYRGAATRAVPRSARRD